MDMNRRNAIFAAAMVIYAALVLNPLYFAHNLPNHVENLSATIAKEPETKFFTDFFERLRARDIAAVKASLDPAIVDKDFQANFDKAASFLSKDTPKSMKFVGMQQQKKEGVTATSLSAEYEFADHWTFANIVVKAQDGTFQVLGFTVRPMEAAMEMQNRFIFGGQGFTHYAVLTAALLLFAFDIYVLALCVKTPGIKRKWLWILFILTGVGRIEFDWTHGGFYFFGNYGNGFYFDFFKFPLVQFSQAIPQPFVVTLTFPLGAVIFFYRRRKSNR